MPIRPPALDDRDFSDLVEELLNRVSAHTPEWSPRLGDPGRTMIDLFAWLTDTLLYRVNLIPERQRLAFLRLLGIALKAATPAQGLVTLNADPAMTQAVSLQALAQIKGPARFETRSEITLFPVTAVAFYKRPLTETEQVDFRQIEAQLKQVYRLGASQQATPYVTTPIFPGGQAQPGGFDLIESTVDKSLWLAILAPKPEWVEQVRQALGQSGTGEQPLLNVGVVPTLEMSDGFDLVAQQLKQAAKQAYVWELSTGREPAYLPLSEVADTSAGLTRSGVVRLELPAPAFIGAPSNDVQVVKEAGVGDRPPRIDDLATAARLVCWLRLRSTAQVSRLSLAWVGINAVAIDQRQTLSGQVIGESDGSANQVFALLGQSVGQSVDPESLVLQVEEPDLGYRVWKGIEDLALADRDDAVYQLDAEAGTVQFGDGVRGRIPSTGMRVRVGNMRAGGGQAGNLPTGSLSELMALDLRGNPVPNLQVWQPLPTQGGEDAESIAAAEQRIPALFRHRDRTVTEGDYRQLALQTPGIRLGRVEVLPRFKPHQELENVPGVVSVMVLPEKSFSKPPNPRPDRLMIEAVYAHLDARRLIGTELYVMGCRYIPLGLSVGVELQDGFRRDSVLLAVRDALYQFLWPLPPGDVNSQGWKLGKSVNDRELEVVVARVDGVRAVNQVKLFVQQSDGRWRKVFNPAQPMLAEVPMRRWELPELLSVVTVIGDAPDDLDAFGRGAGEAISIAIPVVAEVC
jgi:predicted phage baseplate assembly protein